MAKCEYCNRDMLKSNGCNMALLKFDDKTYLRIKVGAKHDFYYGKKNKNIRCHDCNALIGEYHHLGCDCERCPKCHGQLISCECLYYS